MVSSFIDILHEKNVYELNKFLLIKKLKVVRPIDALFAIVLTRAMVERRDDLLATLAK